VQSDGTEGEIRVNATSNGLNADTLTIKTY
jgi:hypothetical protein